MTDHQGKKIKWSEANLNDKKSWLSYRFQKYLLPILVIPVIPIFILMVLVSYIKGKLIK